MFANLRSKFVLSLQSYLREQKPSHFSRRIIEHLRNIHILRTIWRKFFRTPALDFYDFESYLNRGATFSAQTDFSNQELLALHQGELFAGISEIARNFEEPYLPIANSIVIVNCSMAAGGAERQVVNTLLGLKAKGCNVHFIGEFIGFRDDLDFHLPTLVDNDIEFSQAIIASSSSGKIYENISAPIAALISRLSPDEINRLLGMAAQLRSLRPQIVHLWQDQTSVLHGIAALIARVPRIIVSGRNINPTHFSFYTDWLRPGYLALAAAENVIFTNNSVAGAQSYKEWLGFDSSKIQVIRNGVDFSEVKVPSQGQIQKFKESIGINHEQKIVCGIFRMSAEKRPQLWLQTARILAKTEENMAFVIAGDGELLEQTKKLADEYGIKEKVVFLGETQKIPELICSSELLLLTSEYEGTPNVILEANWFGRPIVTTKAGGAAECVDHTKTGLVAANDSADTIAAAVLELLHSKDKKAKNQNQFRYFVKHKFGIERMITETIYVYFQNK